MKQIEIMIGDVFRQNGRLQVQVRFVDGDHGVVTARRRCDLRKRLQDRGVDREDVDWLFLNTDVK